MASLKFISILIFVSHIRERLNPERPRWEPYLPAGTPFHPDKSFYFPRDFDLERPPREGYAQAPRFLNQEHDTQYGEWKSNVLLYIVNWIWCVNIAINKEFNLIKSNWIWKMFFFFFLIMNFQLQNKSFNSLMVTPSAMEPSTLNAFIPSLNRQ